jgi:hypothetical protein
VVFVYGLAVGRFQFFPYQAVRSVYRSLVARAEGDLTKEQRATIERLKSLGYLSGSMPGSGESGVTVYERNLAYPGLNLFTDGHRPQATLIDMEGRQLHRWHVPLEVAFPDSTSPNRFWRRVRLLENGDLLAIYEGKGLIKIDAESRVIWAYPGSAHHDLDVTDQGIIYVLTSEVEILPRISPRDPVLHDFISILDAGGHETRRVSILEAIERSSYPDLLHRMPKKDDLLHTNTLELLDGSLSARLSSFAEGNVLISMPHINTIAVVDMSEEKIVWALGGLWVKQHDPGVLRNGNLLVFDNLGAGGWSRVLEIDPLSQAIVWLYDGSDHDFFTRTIGTNQRLPNGNTLITESESGRAFEVTPSHQIVWEYRTPNRAGKKRESVATLFELIRLDADHPIDWLQAQ